MEHLDDGRLQAYLNGAADPAEVRGIDEHLSRCELCAERLAQLDADDGFLTRNLALDEQEQAWVAGLDLVDPVMDRLAGKIESRLFSGPALIVALAALLAAGWLGEQVLSLLSQAIAWGGPLGLTVRLISTLATGSWYLFLYILGGGLLSQIWPALALGAALWLLRRRWKGAHRYA